MNTNHINAQQTPEELTTEREAYLASDEYLRDMERDADEISRDQGRG